MKVFIVQSSMGYGECQRIEAVFTDLDGQGAYKAEVECQRLERLASEDVFVNDNVWVEERETK